MSVCMCTQSPQKSVAGIRSPGTSVVSAGSGYQSWVLLPYEPSLQTSCLFESAHSTWSHVRSHYNFDYHFPDDHKCHFESRLCFAVKKEKG